jgi:hypothetical protein
MPFETALVISAVVLVFASFGVTLLFAYLSSAHMRRSPQAACYPPVASASNRAVSLYSAA